MVKMMVKLEKIGGILIKLDDLLYFDENDRPSKKLSKDGYDNLKRMFGSICEGYGFYQDTPGFCTYLKIDNFDEACDNVIETIKQTKEFKHNVLTIEKIYFKRVQSYETTRY
jgi:hypothetical protein